MLKMLPEKVIKVLKLIHAKLSTEDIWWVLSGSTSLAIQGAEVDPHNDIDILTDEAGAKMIDKLLSQYRLQSPDYSQTEKFRSFFGIYDIDGVKIDVMGNFQYKMLDGSWSSIASKEMVVIRQFEGMSLPILDLMKELVEYENLNRLDKANKIRDALSKN